MVDFKARSGCSETVLLSFEDLHGQKFHGPSGQTLPVLIHPHHPRGTDDVEDPISSRRKILLSSRWTSSWDNLLHGNGSISTKGTALRELDAIPFHLFWSVATETGRFRITQNRHEQGYLSPILHGLVGVEGSTPTVIFHISRLKQPHQVCLQKTIPSPPLLYLVSTQSKPCVLGGWRTVLWVL